jgi:hypothetical protein
MINSCQFCAKKLKEVKETQRVSDMSQRRAYISHEGLVLMTMSVRGIWIQHDTAMEDYRRGVTRIFRPYEDLIVTAAIDEDPVTWTVMQEAETRQHRSSPSFCIPMGDIIGPEVPYDTIPDFMESVSQGSLQTMEILSPRLSFPASPAEPVVTPIPKHVIKVLLEKAEMDGTECPITGSPITVATGAVTSCGHLFERTAIETWFAQGSYTCPECRASCRI